MNSIKPSQGRIFGTPQDVIKETQKLASLNQKYQLISSFKMPHTYKNMLGRVEGVWKAVLGESVNSVEEFKKRAIEEHQNQLHIRGKDAPQALIESVMNDLDSATNIQEVQKLGKKVFKSWYSIGAAPVKASDVGLTGPTLLVNFPENNFKDKEVFSITAYVLKWTNLEEIGGNILYEAFFNWFGGALTGISVPQTSGFDFNHKLYKTSMGELSVLSELESQNLENSFASILHSLSPQPKMVYGDKLMVAERIQGENFYEFARSKYPKLTEEEKKDLFFKLGLLIPLDIILGNDDRLVKFDINRDLQCSLATYESNLGNMMISQGPKAQSCLTVHPIDNAIQSEFVINKKQRNSYLKFVDSLFKQENLETNIVKSVMLSLKYGLISSADNDKNRGVAMEMLSPIFKDLEQIAPHAIENGIRKMLCSLKESLIPAWNSKDAIFFKKNLRALYPELLDAVDERIQTVGHILINKESLV